MSHPLRRICATLLLSCMTISTVAPTLTLPAWPQFLTINPTKAQQDYATALGFTSTDVPVFKDGRKAGFALLNVVTTIAALHAIQMGVNKAVQLRTKTLPKSQAKHTAVGLRGLFYCFKHDKTRALVSKKVLLREWFRENRTFVALAVPALVAASVLSYQEFVSFTAWNDAQRSFETEKWWYKKNFTGAVPKTLAELEEALDQWNALLAPRMIENLETAHPNLTDRRAKIAEHQAFIARLKPTDRTRELSKQLAEKAASMSPALPESPVQAPLQTSPSLEAAEEKSSPSLTRNSGLQSHSASIPFGAAPTAFGCFKPAASTVLRTPVQPRILTPPLPMSPQVGSKITINGETAILKAYPKHGFASEGYYYHNDKVVRVTGVLSSRKEEQISPSTYTLLL